MHPIIRQLVNVKREFITCAALQQNACTDFQSALPWSAGPACRELVPRLNQARVSPMSAKNSIENIADSLQTERSRKERIRFLQRRCADVCCQCELRILKLALCYTPVFVCQSWVSVSSVFLNRSIPDFVDYVDGTSPSIVTALRIHGTFGTFK